MPSEKHIHRYQRAIIGEKYKVMKCTLPDCTHYFALKQALGKSCVCNRCGQRFIIDKLALTLAKPHCLECTKSKKKNEGPSEEDIQRFLREKGML